MQPMTAIAEMMGIACGIMTLRNTVQCPPPSIKTASAYDHGDDL